MVHICTDKWILTGYCIAYRSLAQDTSAMKHAITLKP